MHADERDVTTATFPRLRQRRLYRGEVDAWFGQRRTDLYVSGDRP